MSTRADQLRSMLERSPADAFLHYALGIELRKQGEGDAAMVSLLRAAELDERQSYAFFQRGQILEERGDYDAAAAEYQRGVDMARAAGDGKALGELQGALDLLP